MARTSDTERILTILNDSPGGLSNQRIRTSLRLSHDRYEEVKQELIESGAAERYVCRGGGLRLTGRGEREATAAAKRSQRPSTVSREADLYPILVEQLRLDAGEETRAIHFAPASLRRRGKWQNPDVVSILIDAYPRIRRVEVLLMTFEVKQADAWDVSAVFEAAAHQRIAHGSTVVLEWLEGSATLEDEQLVEVVRECRRFGIGLATLEPQRRGYSLNLLLEPEPHLPVLAELDAWLDYALEKTPEQSREFERLLDEAARAWRRR